MRIPRPRAWVPALLLALALAAGLAISAPIPTPSGGTVIEGGDSELVDAGTVLYPNELGDEFVVGATSAVGGAKVSINGDTASQVGFLIQGATSQTADLFKVQSSVAGLVASISAAGDQTLGGSMVWKDTANCLDPPSGSTGVCTLAGRFYTRDTGGATQEVPLKADILGKETYYVPSLAMYPKSTNGATGPTPAEFVAGQPEFAGLVFVDGSTKEAEFTVKLPSSWNLGNIEYRPFVTTTASTGAAVVGVACVARGNSEAIATAYPALTTVTVTVGNATNELAVGSYSTPFTPGGTPTKDELLWCRFSRVGADAADTLPADLRPVGLEFRYTTNQLNDNS